MISLAAKFIFIGLPHMSYTEYGLSFHLVPHLLKSVVRGEQKLSYMDGRVRKIVLHRLCLELLREGHSDTRQVMESKLKVMKTYCTSLKFAFSRTQT